MHRLREVGHLKVCFIIRLLYASTCFEHYVLIIRSKLYYTASGIITPVGGHPLSTCAPDGHLESVMIPDAV